MIEHEYKLTDMNNIYGFEFRIGSGKCIIHTESGTDMYVDGKWQPEKGYIICISFLFDNELKVLCRSFGDNHDFEKSVNTMLERLKGVQLYACNKSIEEGNLYALFGTRFSINEIKDFRFNWTPELSKNYYSLYGVLGKEFGLKLELKEPYSNSKESILLWSEYKENKDHTKLTPIIQKAIVTTLKEAIIYRKKDTIEKLITSRG